jgi:exodeoxyribonuclease VIII
MSQLIRNMPAEEYHSHPAISKSGLDRLAETPAHYRWYADHREEMPETDALRIGRAFHTMLLEPKLFDKECAVGPDVSRATKEWKAFAHENDGKLLLKGDEHRELQAMCASILDHPAARAVLSGKGMIEPSLFWTDETTGVECRARFDWLRFDGLIVDLKSATDASPETFQGHAWKHRYHVQDAFYREAHERVTGKPAAGFVFLVVEKKPPYAVAVYTMDDAARAAGDVTWRNNLSLYAHCKDDDRWPAYSPKIETLSPPRWA